MLCIDLCLVDALYHLVRSLTYELLSFFGGPCRSFRYL
jgi:hypothetical protein